MYKRQGRNVGIGRLTVNVGKTVHLEARHVLKNFGRVNIASASNVELVQGSGWFRTSEWLTDNQVNYDLTVQAKSIAVDSDHRFGKDLVLRAEDNIWHNDSVISANKITYAAGKDISIKFNPFKWREANPNAANANWWDTVSGGLRGHTLLAGKGGITLYAGQDVKLQSGKIHTSTSVDITAGRHIISAPWYQTRFGGNVPGAVGWSFSDKYGFEGDWTPPNSSDYDSHIVGNAGQATIDVRSGSQGKLKERRAYVNHITANGDVRLKAGKTVNLIGTYVSSRDSSIDIQATVGINIAAASGYRKYDDYWTTRGGKWPFKKTHHDTVKQYDDIYTASYLESKNGEVRLLSEGNILSAGTRILAGGDLLVKSDEGNIELGTYKERYFREHYYRKERHGLGGIKGDDSSSITIDTNFNTGNNFDSDKQLTLKTESTESALRIVGGTYNAKKVRILAAGNLYIDAAINDVKLTEFSEKGNGITITTINSGVDRESAALPEITSAEDIDFAIGGEVHIGGWRGRDLNSSLISTIGNRDFENALVNLYTPDAQATAASAAQSVNQQYLRDFDLPGASDGQQFEYLDTLVRDYGATYHTIQLRDRTWYDKQTRLSPAFQALLQIAATYVTGGLSLGVDKVLLNAAIRSASATALSGAVGGVITGNFDLGDILEDAALAGSSAYITTFLTTSIDFGAGFSDDSIFVNSVGDSSRFAPSAIVDRLGDRVISNGVSNVFNGEKFFEGIDKLGKTFLVSEALAVTQFGIGELGEGNASFEGSIGHLLLHGGAGCVALVAIDGNCAAGFFSGASQSVLAGSGLSDQQKADLVPLVGALAGFAFSDGEAINVTFGSTIATSGLENNYLSHQQVDDLTDRLRACGNDENCKDEAYDYYRMLSRIQDQQLLACTTAECINYHTSRAEGGRQAFAAITLEERQEFGLTIGISGYVDISKDVITELNKGRSNTGQADNKTKAEVKAEVARLHCSGLTSTECSLLGDKIYWEVYQVENRQRIGLEILIGDLRKYPQCQQGDLQACGGIVTDLLFEKKLSGGLDASKIAIEYFNLNDIPATNTTLPDVVSEAGKTWNKTIVNGRSVYKNNKAFDPNLVDPDTGLTNIQRMKKGRPPVGTDGKPVELHHMTQNEVNGFNGSRGAVAEVTNGFHNKNYNTIHIYKKGDPEYVSWRKNNPQAEREFNNFRRSYWKERAGDF